MVCIGFCWMSWIIEGNKTAYSFSHYCRGSELGTEGGLAIASSLSSLVSLQTIFLRSTFLIADDSTCFCNPVGNCLFHMLLLQGKQSWKWGLHSCGFCACADHIAQNVEPSVSWETLHSEPHIAPHTPQGGTPLISRVDTQESAPFLRKPDAWVCRFNNSDSAVEDEIRRKLPTVASIMF